VDYINYSYASADPVRFQGHLSNVIYIVSGTGLLLLGLLFLLMAVEFLGYNDYYLTTILIFFCFFCDIIAAIIAFTALFLQPKD
jgi:predicted membrane protein